MTTTRHLISIDDFTNDEIIEIFRIADELEYLQLQRSSTDLLKNKIVATLFYEPSTRTRLSFESATYRLGGRVISVPDMEISSSVAKGETIADTAKVVSQYADAIVIRHPRDGAARVAALSSDAPVVNAGDGSHEHPTQTLCDLYTLRKEKGEIKGLTVALCGDLRFGRTIHSLAVALARFGAELILISPKDLGLPDHLRRRLEIKHGIKLESAESLEFISKQFQGLDAVYMTAKTQETFQFEDELTLNLKVDLSKKISRLDVVYMTRYQKERPAKQQRTTDYPKLDREVLRSPRLKQAIVMHPLPRLDEIPKDLDHDPRSKYFKQVEYGVVVRMALLRFLLDRTLPSSPRPLNSKPGRSSWYVNTLSPRDLGPICPNDSCISHYERELRLEFSILTREKTYTSHFLILECAYCSFEVSLPVVGNAKTRKFCRYDPTLESLVEYWHDQGLLVLFMNESQAKRLGFSPYSKGSRRQVLNSKDVASLIEKLSKDIVSAFPNYKNLCLIGIRSRGDIIAKRIASKIERDLSFKPQVASLDVLPFRDDVYNVRPPKRELGIPIDDQVVVLVDDVLHTGRTSRAAIKAIFWHGRPKDVKTAFLINRGHKELPIQADFVGKDLPTSKTERVQVRLGPRGKDEVVIYNIIDGMRTEA